MSFPSKRCRTLAATNRNFYSFTMRRDMAATYLYLFPADNRTKQWIGAKLGIKTNIIRTASETTKKLKE